jgi:hypothetical protein
MQCERSHGTSKCLKLGARKQQLGLEGHEGVLESGTWALVIHPIALERKPRKRRNCRHVALRRSLLGPA